MLSDVNVHYLTLVARCPVSGCWLSCTVLGRNRNRSCHAETAQSFHEHGEPVHFPVKVFQGNAATYL